MDPITIGLGLAKFVGPTVARWIAGDKGEEAAKDVISIAEKVTGRKGVDAENAIASDPKLALKFKNAVLDNETEMNKLYLADKQDARKRDLELRKMGYNNIRADIMILAAAVVLIVDIYMLYSNPNMPNSVVAIFNMIAGSVLTMLNSAYQFEFGSSRGSKEKDIK